MERQWGTVREDYSENGGAWNYFTHDQARSRATQREAGVSSAPRAAPLTRAITVDGDAVSFGAFQHCSLRDRRSTRRAHPPFQLSPSSGGPNRRGDRSQHPLQARYKGEHAARHTVPAG